MGRSRAWSGCGSLLSGHLGAVSSGVECKVPLYLGLGIDICLVLQQELHQLDVSIMAGHVEWGVTHLKGKR